MFPTSWVAGGGACVNISVLSNYEHRSWRSLSTRQGVKVPDRELCCCLGCRWSSETALSTPSSAECTALSTNNTRSSEMRLRTLFGSHWKHCFLDNIDVISALQVLTTMRYINRRLTYLLAYLLTYLLERQRRGARSYGIQLKCIMFHSIGLNQLSVCTSFQILFPRQWLTNDLPMLQVQVTSWVG